VHVVPHRKRSSANEDLPNDVTWTSRTFSGNGGNAATT